MTRNIRHAKLRNEKRELTPFLSRERFVYIKAGLRRALPSVVDINHNKCRIFHPSHEKSCSRCRYMGHYRQNTDIIHIRSPNNVMSNFYQCIVTMDGVDYPTPGSTKGIASLSLRHILGMQISSCHARSIVCKSVMLKVVTKSKIGRNY